jgi:hypothetical protein
VRTENPLSEVFESFRANGDLQTLIATLQRSSAEVFASVRAMSIESFLDTSESRRRATTEKVGQLFHFGTPLIQLRIEGADDSLRNMTYFGSSSGEQSPLLEVARKQGRAALPFRASSDTEVVFVTTKVGFPAFHIALISHCDRALQASADPGALHAVPEWQLPSLIPSAIELGTEDDPVRQLACQSLALGLVTEGEGGLIFEEQVIGSSYRGFVELLNSLRGAGLTARLQVRAAEAMKLENAADLLSDFLRRSQRDEIDQRIIQSMLDRLDV